MKRKLWMIFMLSFTLAAVSGCSAGNEQNTLGTAAAAETTIAPELSPEEVEQQEYEDKLAAGTITAEECVALGDLYSASGEVLQQRNIWEMAQMLSFDPDLQGRLASLVTPVAENSEDIRDIAALVTAEAQNGNADALLERMESEEWRDTLLPNLLIGQRTYEQAEDAFTCRILLRADEYGDFYSAVWYHDSNGQIFYVAATPAIYKTFTAGYDNGTYQGAFQITTMEKANGSVYSESGTLTDNLCTGEFVERIFTGSEPVEHPLEYWKTREALSFTEYKGSFTEEGHTTVEQADRVSSQDLLMYGTYDRNGDILYVSVPLAEGESAENYTFTNETFGITADLLEDQDE